ncbi:hypothetical protein FGO68_gene3362 [Halteria grandinella]|uniref:Uncharacterized protein n=1 Tax=Halteria grandinella TaxID=5974 RepID=A0A8J8T6J0_HALGN|nr:hypothetical protein FGO68_gene3362 [Halteria grandinella]
MSKEDFEIFKKLGQFKRRTLVVDGKVVYCTQHHIDKFVTEKNIALNLQRSSCQMVQKTSIRLCRPLLQQIPPSS